MSQPSSPTPSSASSPDVINRAATKLCHIIKRPDFDGYGFNLHSEKAKPGQFIGKVDANSPAEAAGLKEGDRIIEVNGTAINSETHKQVVQRIKAISCEVRLLLVDVDGKGDGKLLLNGNQSSNGMESTTKTEQVLPGTSENINSITMVSTKRPSQEAQRSSAIPVAAPVVPVNGNNGMDVTDKAINSNDHHHHHQMMTTTINNNNIPPPPSATMASVGNKTTMMTTMNSSSNGNTITETISTTTTTASSSSSMTTGSGNSTNKAGSLNLPMTVAEMRAKLAMKKKYDPKNESVDLKKKYEIVQKL